MAKTCEFCGTVGGHKRLVCEARVARLEGELAEAKAMLSDNPDHSDLDAVVFEANRLEGRNAALTAALRETGADAHSAYMNRHLFPATRHEGTFMDCPTALCTNRRAALSDTGEGMEVREQAWRVIGKLLIIAEGYSDAIHTLGLKETSTRETEITIGEARAALAALGGE